MFILDGNLILVAKLSEDFFASFPLLLRWFALIIHVLITIIFLLEIKTSFEVEEKKIIQNFF